WGPRAIGDHGAPVSLPKLKKAFGKNSNQSLGPHIQAYTQNVPVYLDASIQYQPDQGWNDNSWGPWAIGDHGASVSLPKLKKTYEKGTRGILWGPLLTPGPRAVPEFPNGQSAPE
ncbi:unnamed protein product, partial [Staurois parvus]